MNPRFRGTLAVSPYPDGVTWYLDRPLTYVRTEGPIKIPLGFETDFASVPQALQNLFPRWDVYGMAAVLHDWIYWSQPVKRDEADAIFFEAMEATKVPRWRRWALYGAVRAFGAVAWDDNAMIGAQGYSRIHTKASPKVPAWRELRSPCR